MCHQTAAIWREEPSLLRVRSPVTVCGDIHGSFDHLLHVFRICGRPPSQSFVFLGDYIDRGRNSVECICLLMLLKCRYPNNMHLLRGNHESRWISRVYGTLTEVVCRYGGDSVWRALMTSVDEMPLAGLIDGKVLCVHGGISPHMRTVDDISLLKRGTDVPGYGLACDLLWSDPSTHPMVSHWSNNHRHVSYAYGPMAVAAFCVRSGVDFIVRAHQPQMPGYKWSPCGRVLTLFTAPNYCQMGNDGCVMCFTADKKYQFRILRPRTASYHRFKHENNAAPSSACKSASLQ